MNNVYYFPWKDFLVTSIVTVMLVSIGGISVGNDAIFIFVIYILSLALTNLNKQWICKHDKETRKARVKIEKKIQNPRKKVKVLPKSLKEFGKNYDYDICFEVIRFVLGMLVTIVLVSISSIFHLQNAQFGKLAYGFYIDAFLFPLILLILEFFWIKQSFIKTCRNFLKNIFIHKGKMKPVSGSVFLILFILLTGLAVIATMSEFFSNDVEIIFRIIYFLFGLYYLGYSIKNAISN
jgi:hypothetical protein